MTDHPTSAPGLALVLDAGCRSIEQTIDDYLSARGGPAAAAQRLQEAVTSLRRHIFAQEELLLPLLRGTTLDGPAHAMSVDHLQLWDTLDRVEAGLAAPTDPEVRRTAARILQAELDRHTTKERPIIFDHVEDVLSPEQQREVAERIETVEMPPGWVCPDPSGD